MGCKSYAPSETFLIPEKFKGAIVIVFENANSVNNKEDRIYKIPQNGILYTPYDRISGILKHKYYYIDSLGHKVKEIKNFDYEEYHNKLKSNDTYRLDMYDGMTTTVAKSSKSKANQKTVSSNDFEKIKWMYITLGSSEDDRQELRRQANSLIDSISKYYPEKYIP